MATDALNPVLGVSSNNKIEILHSTFLTRHGIIAGSTGTGKSRAMQLLAEQLADSGVNVFVSDVKGDASGFCVAGSRHERNALAQFVPHSLRANYWSLSTELARLRFSLQDVGPVLLSRLLELNSTQESHLSLVFSYVRKNNKTLHSIDDLLSVLNEMIVTGHRGISKSSMSVIERKLLSLQEAGMDKIFGKRFVELEDLGGLNVLNLSDSRKNMLASITPAFLLQKLFNELPEVGDVDVPKYVLFFDEAHYLFKDANKSLRNLIVTILKQIRSKGVAVFFITQDVADLPEDVLSQLGTKIIFAQRVASAKGEATLRSLSKSFPKTTEFDIAEELKALAPGVAVVTTLDALGQQTKPKKVTMFAPATSMNVIDYQTLRSSTNPALLKKYAVSNDGRITKTNPEFLEKKPSPVVSSASDNSKSKKASVWIPIFWFLLKFLDFILKAGGKVVNAVVIKPLQNFFKWMFRKPIRVLYLLLILLILYMLFVNWHLIDSVLKLLRF